MGVDPSAFIHPKAHVEGSYIGARTRVWQFASVIRGTILGDDCNVASCATLDGPVFGDRCIISQGVAMGPGFFLGDDIFVGPNVTFCNDRWPTASKECLDLDALRNGFVTIRVMDGASIGANVVVLPGVIIGAGAVIAAGAAVNRSIPADHVLSRSGKIRPIGTHLDLRRMIRSGEC